ncbi:MAG: tyrosine-type recombinase/integrase [Polaromonas sp.]|nr:tyrosine-type recombinase/integrase [Polaromonas sp.]
MEVLREQIGQNLHFFLAYKGQPLWADVTNTAWLNALAKAGIKDFRFHNLRHTWASWHRQTGTPSQSRTSRTSTSRST